jgi:hypothetical protein
MNERAGMFARLLALAAVLAVANGSCVRADPPTSYRCVSSSECPAGERCSGGDCLAPGACIGRGNCSGGQLCKLGQCIDPECDASHPDACHGYACVDGLCNTSCTYGDMGCQSGGDFMCDYLTSKCMARPRYRGESCTVASDCLSGECCGPPGNLTCGICFGLGSFCTTASDCASGYCCSKPFGGGQECFTGPCP